MSTAWGSQPGARRLIAWRGQELSALALRLDEVLGAWSRDWGLPAESAGTTACAEAQAQGERSELGWLQIGQGNGAAWIAWHREQAAQLARSWFQADAADTPVVQAIVQACRCDLVQRLCAALELEAVPGTGAPVSQAWQRFSGAVVAELGAGVLLMEAKVVEGLLRRGTRDVPAAGQPLVPVANAIAQNTLQLQVQLEGCELAMGDVAALRLGDVVRLGHRTDMPAVVVQAGGPVLFKGWLARSRGRRAVELAP